MYLPLSCRGNVGMESQAFFPSMIVCPLAKNSAPFSCQPENVKPIYKLVKAPDVIFGFSIPKNIKSSELPDLSGLLL